MSTATLPYSRDIAYVVDEYGKIEAQIARLMRRRQQISASIARWGSGDYEGFIYEIRIRKAHGQSLEIGGIRITERRPSVSITCHLRSGKRVSRQVV